VQCNAMSRKDDDADESRGDWFAHEDLDSESFEDAVSHILISTPSRRSLVNEGAVAPVFS
jgi:hypothetical protein